MAKKPFTNCKLEFNTEIKTADENEEGQFINEYQYMEIKDQGGDYKNFIITF